MSIQEFFNWVVRLIPTQIFSLPNDTSEFIREVGETVANEADGNAVLGGNGEDISRARYTRRAKEGGGLLENISSIFVSKSFHLALRMLFLVQHWSRWVSGNPTADIMKIG